MKILAIESSSLVASAAIVEELLPQNCIFIEIKKDTAKGFDYRVVSIKEGRK